MRRLRWISLGAVLVAAVAVAVLSFPARTIDRVVNPDGVHNLHLVDSDPDSGFAIYRLGMPGAEDLRGLCALGVTEIAVLSGSAERHEARLATHCPELRVVYDVEQDMRPLDTGFLDAFDAWVEDARASGRKIAFRCSCGCHRTGRLAAYYQMRFRGLSAKEAWDLALARGKGMGIIDRLAGIQTQILALEEHIHGRPCTQGEMCVVESDGPAPTCDEPIGGCGWLER